MIGKLWFGPLQVLNIEGSHRETLLRYVKLLQIAKQHRRALEYAIRAVNVHPEDFELNLLHADCLRCARKALQARALCSMMYFYVAVGSCYISDGWQYQLLQ